MVMSTMTHVIAIQLKHHVFLKHAMKPISQMLMTSQHCKASETFYGLCGKGDTYT